MDFLSFFGLREDPFKLTPDPAYFYPSATHNEGLLLLDYSIEQKEGFTTVIGEPGSGKTTLLNVFLEKWKSKAGIAIILTPRLSPEEFLVSVLEDLNISLKRKNKNEIIKAFRDLMIEKSYEGRWVIIIVDEAQNLPDETLEELRLLSNLETDKDKLLQIVLLGQPELETKLTRDKLRQLNQRITTRIHLRHFTPDETLDYINYRLIKAGRQNLQIDRNAGRLAYKLSKGIPRLINMLVSRALMAAYLEESSIILPGHIRHAVKSLNHSDMRLRNRSEIMPAASGVLAVLLITASAYFLTQHVKTNPADEMQKRKAEPAAPLASVTQTMEAPNIVDNRPGEIKLVSVIVDIANIREKPVPDSEIIGKLSNGARLAVLQEHADENNIKWYQVLYRGEKRWIAGELVEAVDLETMNENKEAGN